MRLAVGLLAVMACTCVACGSEEKSASSHTTRMTEFVRRVDNPWFPLVPGTVFVYRGMKDGERGRDVVRVTNRIKPVDGMPCTVVEDRLYVSGHLAERTADWYTQDTKGNVWYCGEDTAELSESGRVTSREGSWESGVDGARAGILVLARPRVGRSYLQEYYKGHAEDHAQVLRVSAGELLTKEWTPLEPDVLDHKLYRRGTGLVKEETIKGGQERWVLNAVRHR